MGRRCEGGSGARMKVCEEEGRGVGSGAGMRVRGEGGVRGGGGSAGRGCEGRGRVRGVTEVRVGGEGAVGREAPGQGCDGVGKDGRRGGGRTRGLGSLEGAAPVPNAVRLTSSTVRRGRCSVPSSSLSFTADERPWKQRRMLSMTAAVSRDAMLGGAHSSSVAPSLLCSHRPVSLSRMDAILGGRKPGAAEPASYVDTYAPSARTPNMAAPGRTSRGDVSGGAVPRRDASWRRRGRPASLRNAAWRRPRPALWKAVGDDVTEGCRAPVRVGGVPGSGGRRKSGRAASAGALAGSAGARRLLPGRLCLLAPRRAATEMAPCPAPAGPPRVDVCFPCA